MPSPPTSPPFAAYKKPASTNTTSVPKDSSRPGSSNSASSGSTSCSNTKSSINRMRKGDAAYTITEECERLFCETLHAVFLGERNAAVSSTDILQDSRVMDTYIRNKHGKHTYNASSDSMNIAHSFKKLYINEGSMSPKTETSPVDSGTFDNTLSRGRSTSQEFSVGSPALPLPRVFEEDNNNPLKRQAWACIEQHLEIWDYAGAGSHFRGFVVKSACERVRYQNGKLQSAAEEDVDSCNEDDDDSSEENDKTLFIFLPPKLDQLKKPTLMALLELASTAHPSLSCSRLVMCLDREIEPGVASKLVRDLGWVGFELATLAPWAGGAELTSDRWLFMDMEV